MIITLLFVTIICISYIAIVNLPVFGSLPKSDRLKKVKSSRNYKNGNFENLSPTDPINKDATLFKLLKEYINKPSEVIPKKLIPVVKTDLKTLWNTNPTIVWFGHSSYLIKSSSITILIDPVFSGYASPFSFMVNAFKGSNVYQVEDLPIIDAVFITHDHFDHLDYETISKLKSHNISYYVPIGVGPHLEHWGIPSDKITELDWNETTQLSNQVTLTCLPARHFSGRLFKRAQSLWTSYYLNLDGFKLFLGGDSGYDSHFAEIGNNFGPFDIALLEAGQFGKYWPQIHMFPHETVQAALDLKASVLFPIHWGKFALAMHNWNEPIQEIIQLAKSKDLTITTPSIGEPVVLANNYPNVEWWHLK